MLVVNRGVPRDSDELSRRDQLKEVESSKADGIYLPWK